MKSIATHEAKTHLSRYLKAVSEEGERIVITRGRQPLAMLVPFRENDGESAPPKVGETMDVPLRIPDEAFAPMGRASLKEWGL